MPINDPHLSKLMAGKAQNTSAINLVVEIETLHDGLHQATKEAIGMAICMKSIKSRLEGMIEKESNRDPKTYRYTEEMARMISEITISLDKSGQL